MVLSVRTFLDCEWEWGELDLLETSTDLLNTRVSNGLKVCLLES